MRTIAILLSVAACLIQAAAATAQVGEIPPIIGTTPIIFTNSVVVNLATTKSSTNSTLSIYAVNHTIQTFYNAIGTNGAATIYIDRTCDSSNWVNVATYSVSTSATNFEYNASGKWAAYRERQSSLATNGTITFSYLGQ